MPEKLRASCINNDLEGTVAVDGHGAPPLFDWWQHVEEETDGYRPVGARIGRANPDEEGEISITMFAVRCEEAGESFDDWVAFEERTGLLPTYSFEARMTVDEFYRHIKRLDITVFFRGLAEKTIKRFNKW